MRRPSGNELAVGDRALVHLAHRTDLFLHLEQAEGGFCKGDGAEGVDDATEHFVLRRVVERPQRRGFFAGNRQLRVLRNCKLELPGNGP